MPTPPAARRAPRLYREDFPVGHRAEPGSIRVDCDEVIEFASRFDPQPFHLDGDAAAQTQFGLLCTSRWHTASMTMRMMVDGDLR
jgi:acyl dehydratase